MVWTTVGSEAEARNMARALVEGRLAACVQIVPVASVYRWEGAVEEAAEHLLLCKIASADFAAVEAAIRARHGYDVPEIVMTGIADGHAPYLAWLADGVGHKVKIQDGRQETSIGEAWPLAPESTEASALKAQAPLAALLPSRTTLSTLQDMNKPTTTRRTLR